MDWKNCWEKDITPWHKTELNPMVEKYLDKLTGKKEGVKLFLPLCGKALELLYLSMKGHSVVGVEFSAKAVKEFFEENKISYSTTTVSEMTLYENNEKRIKIYCGDFFKFCDISEKDFDGVWDRGSLEAIDQSMREEYASIMKSVVRTGAGYVVEISDRTSGGPPFNVPVDDIKKIFSLKTEPEEIDFQPPTPFLKEQGVQRMVYYYFQLE